MSDKRPNPYVGPRAFRPGETLYGRDRESDELLDLLLAERVVLFHAPSGAGKTSLLQASLQSRLKDEGLHVLPIARVKWRPVTQPDEKFNPYMYSAMLDFSRPPEATSAERASVKYEALRDSMRKGLEAFLTKECVAADQLQVLIFDQFEELITLDANDIAGKHAFCKELGRVLQSRSRFAIFSMREDFVGAMEPYLGHFGTRLAARYRLDFLTPEAAKLAIERPVEPDVKYDTRAVDKLVADLRKVMVQTATGQTQEAPGAFIEPVHLQVVCTRIWNALAPNQRSITLKHVEQHGSVDRALRGYYADAVARAAREGGSSESDIRHWIGSRLIVNRLRGQALRGSEVAKGVSEASVTVLEDTYVIRRDQRRGAEWYELAHDRLVVPVLADNAEWQIAQGDWIETKALAWREYRDPAHLLKIAQMPRAWFSRRDMSQAQRTRVDDYWRASVTKAFIGMGVPLLLLAFVVIAGMYMDSRETREANRGQRAALDSVNQLLAVNGKQRDSLRNLVDSLTAVQERYIYQRAWGLDSGSSKQVVQQSIQANQALQTIARQTTPTQRRNVLVRYYQKSRDKQRIEFALRELGYEVEVLPALARADQPTNSIAYGPSVPLSDLKVIALTIVRAGTEVRSICPMRNVRDRAMVTEVTYSARAESQRPIDLKEIAALTRSQPELNCPNVPSVSSLTK